MQRVVQLFGLAALALGTFLLSGAKAMGKVSPEPLANGAPTASPRRDAILADFSGKLTTLEQGLFDDAADGHLDDLSLLEAALIASGEDRKAMLRHYEKQLASLLEELRPTVDSESSEERKAERVFEFLHRRVLHGGYHLEGTDIRSTFEEGRYNCVSASVLFNCLASGVGLSCCGLEAPEHVLSRVFLKNGILDVETTAPRWFRLQRASAKLPVREVTPIQMTAMIYYNRGVDYLAEKRFAEAAAVNAKSLRLDPQNATVRGNFLATLNNWSIERGAAHHYAAAIKLLETGMIYDRQYRAFQQNCVYLYREWSEQLCSAGRFSEAVDLLQKAAVELPEKKQLKQSMEDIYRRWASSDQE